MDLKSLITEYISQHDLDTFTDPFTSFFNAKPSESQASLQFFENIQSYSHSIKDPYALKQRILYQ